MPFHKIKFYGHNFLNKIILLVAYPTPLKFEASQKKFEAPPPKRLKKLKVTDTGKSTLTSPLKDECKNISI